MRGLCSDEAMGEMVSGNFFSGLGVRMRLGGGFKMEDERRHTPLVVLSFEYWTYLYSRDPDVAGRTIYIRKAFPSPSSGSLRRDFPASSRDGLRTSGFRCKAVLN